MQRAVPEAEAGRGIAAARRIWVTAKVALRSTDKTTPATKIEGRRCAKGRPAPAFPPTKRKSRRSSPKAARVPRDRHYMGNGQMSLQDRCTREGDRADADGDGKFKADSFEPGHHIDRIRGRGDNELTRRFTGKRVGECTPEGADANGGLKIRTWSWLLGASSPPAPGRRRPHAGDQGRLRPRAQSPVPPFPPATRNCPSWRPNCRDDGSSCARRRNRGHQGRRRHRRCRHHAQRPGAGRTGPRRHGRPAGQGG